VLALAWGLFVWIMVPAAYIAQRGYTPGKLDLATMPPRDVAFLAAVPHLAALVAVVTVDLLFYRGDLTGLGFSARQARQGVWTGLLLGCVFVPLVFGVAVLIEWLYRAAGYQHPPEHDILHVLGGAAEPWVRLALVGGAIVVAPLSEELLFRGHAQTVFRRALARLAGPQPPPRAFPLANEADVVTPSEQDIPPTWATWGAILLASALFASVHAMWTWPTIFVLSVCLGWVYERTGNLWASVAVHAAFNGASTIIFLKFGAAG
jgi:membrane protease YdiL (CAAX protease family)